MRLSKPSRAILFATAVLSFFGGWRARAQVDTGEILGTIRDPTGGVVPGAKVMLTNEGTSVSVSTVSHQDGTYIFTPVRIGVYTISAGFQGFQTARHLHVSVNIQQQVVVDFSLQPGNVTETVEVTAAPPLLQTQSGSMGQVVGSQQINDLPLNGRNFTFLAQLAPGVTFAQSDNRGLGASGNFAANGMRPAQNNYLLDGVDNNNMQPDYRGGTSYSVLPPVDAIQEFKIQTSAFNAEFGRAGGGVLNASIKSGTNQYHGDAWEFLRNDKLDAPDFFENAGGLPKGEFRRNQFGGTIGGPVLIPRLYNGKDKTFFFADYQGTRIRQALPYLVTVPTAAERSGGYTNFTDLISSQPNCSRGPDLLGRTVPCGTIFDPATTRSVTSGQTDAASGRVATGTGYVRDPFPGNLVAPSRLDPNAVKLLNLYPSPNLNGLLNNFADNPITVDDTNSFDLRIDQYFGPRDVMFGRVSYSLENRDTPGPFPGVADGVTAVFGGNMITTGANAAWSETHTFGASTVNEVLLGYNRIHSVILQPFGNDLSNIPAQYGIQGIPQIPQNGGLPTFSIGNLDQLGSNTFFPIDKASDVIQVSDNLSKVWKSHSFKVGFEYENIRFTNEAPPDSRGKFTFGGTYTSIPNISDGSTGIAQFLLTPIASTAPGGVSLVGGANTVAASNFAVPDYGRGYYGIYGQDDWKISKRLTLNLGLRWDYFGQTGENYGAAANFVPGAPFNGAEYLVSASRAAKNELPLSPAFVNVLAKDGISLVQSSKFGLGTSQTTNFAPRLGFAYQAADWMVVRGGYGIFYGGFEDIGGDNLGGNYPFLYTFSFPTPDAAHPITYSNGQTATLEEGFLGIPLSPLLVNPTGLQLKGIQYDYRTAYTQSYNLALQFKLRANQTLSVGYVGSAARHLITSPGSNIVSEMLPPPVNPQLYVPFPDLGRGANYDATEGNSGYNALQVTFERQYSHGLSILSDYTWSKCRTDARDRLNGDIGGYRAPGLAGFGIQGDYSLCDFDVRQIFHLSGGYDLPVGRGKAVLGNAGGFTNAVLGGWRMSYILTLQDGQPLTVACNPGTSAGFGCNALYVPGQDIYGGQHNVNQWLNPAAYRNPPAATAIGQTDLSPLGGAPGNAIGPGFHRLDWSLFKEFRTSETTHVEFRAEFFNLTNHPNFAQPGSLNFTNPTTFAKITATRDNPNDPREIQLALKFYW
ncbi:MAG TPA: carboxypeptidase-like regulatory domain-containing protein [Bryobacteraceae bacterium]|nr:carboxypeptidase-like regulatory domain-containing protein [Bryobacteraceae bacterium]